MQEKKSWQKKVSKYVRDKKEEVIKTFFVTCHMWHVTNDITPDTLHMGVWKHGVNFYVASCCGLRVKVLKRYWINCWIPVALTVYY